MDTQNSPNENTTPEITFEVNTVESSTSKHQQPRSKKKCKGKSKQSAPQKEKPMQNDTHEEKWKPRYPCLICNDDHYTKESMYRVEVNKFLKGSSTLSVLKDPFPSQDSKTVAHNSASSSTSADLMVMSSQVFVETRSKDYGSKNP